MDPSTAGFDDHTVALAQVAAWRRERAILRTLGRRPELLDKAELAAEERQMVDRLRRSLAK